MTVIEIKNIILYYIYYIVWTYAERLQDELDSMNFFRSGNPKIFIAEREVDIQSAENTTRTTCLQYFLRFVVDDCTEYLSNNVLWSLRRDYFYVTSRSSHNHYKVYHQQMDH